MHEHDPLTDAIIGSAIEVHRHLGPGLLENTYEEALSLELAERGVSFQRQIGVPVLYKGRLIGEHRPDLIIAATVIVEIKSVEKLHAVHTAQILAYMRLLGLRTGLLMNFNEAVLKNGIRRFAL